MSTSWKKSSYSGNGASCVEWRKSSYSLYNATCVEWNKSSYCDSGSCFEVSHSSTHDNMVQVRDSKDPDGPILSFHPNSWTSFIEDVKVGKFNL